MRSDSVASTLRPVRMRSSACDKPTRRGSPQKRLGSNLSRLSQIQDGKWKVVSDYVTP